MCPSRWWARCAGRSAPRAPQSSLPAAADRAADRAAGGGAGGSARPWDPRPARGGAAHPQPRGSPGPGRGRCAGRGRAPRAAGSGDSALRPGAAAGRRAESGPEVKLCVRGARVYTAGARRGSRGEGLHRKVRGCGGDARGRSAPEGAGAERGLGARWGRRAGPGGPGAPVRSGHGWARGGHRGLGTEACEAPALDTPGPPSRGGALPGAAPSPAGDARAPAAGCAFAESARAGAGCRPPPRLSASDLPEPGASCDIGAARRPRPGGGGGLPAHAPLGGGRCWRPWPSPQGTLGLSSPPHAAPWW